MTIAQLSTTKSTKDLDIYRVKNRLEPDKTFLPIQPRLEQPTLGKFQFIVFLLDVDIFIIVLA